ncbi:MAG TPA: hypothetical protein VIC33_17495 [Vicinamibacterales bacterium]|jgi:hypothetical protein
MTASTSAADPVIPARPQATAPIRLLKAVTLFGVGGSERQFTDLALGLDQSRFDLRIACLKQWGFFLKNFEDRRIPVREFRAAMPIATNSSGALASSALAIA